MKTTLYYFSGTGNSLKAARDIASKLGESVLIAIASFRESTGDIMTPAGRWDSSARSMISDSVAVRISERLVPADDRTVCARPMGAREDASDGRAALSHVSTGTLMPDSW